MTMRLFAVGLISAMSLVAARASAQQAAASAPAFEVWIVDQSDSRGKDHGGTLHIFSGGALSGDNPASATPAVTVDLEAETSALCRELTGANPVRPHMVLFNHEHTHASLAFVASGHVVLFDADAGTIVLNGPLTTNAAPDLADTSPSGGLVFVALRGPTPLSGDPHNATGATPGLGIIEVTDAGRSGRLRAIVRLTNVGADGVERADPHGLRVRRLR